MEILEILTAIAGYFGLEIGSLLAIAASIMVLVNFLKATPPFSEWVTGDRIPYVVGVLSLVISAVSNWGDWLALLVSAVLVAVISIGGWATVKMVVHKSGTPASNKSGGG